MASITISQPASGGGEGQFNGWYRDEVALNADGYYDIEAGYILEKLIIFPGANAVVKIGKTAGGEEVLASVNITTDGELVTVNMHAKENPIRIYFTGIPANSSIVFFKRTINDV
jgi:hypothetical protein